MTERIDATNTTEHMADAESTAESAKAAVRGVEETHPEYVDFTVDDFTLVSYYVNSLSSHARGPAS